MGKLLQVLRAVLHVGVVVALTLRSAHLNSALHPYDRSLANEWIHLLFFVDGVKNTTTDDGEVVQDTITLPHFLLEIEEEIAANVDDEFFSSGFAARASSYPVGILFTIDEMKQHLHGAVANYFQLPDIALDSYLIADPTKQANATDNVPLPRLTLHMSNATDAYELQYSLTGRNESDWPPVLQRQAIAPDTREFLDLLDSMELRFIVGMTEKTRKEGAKDTDVFAWWIAFQYDLESQGHLELSMNYGLDLEWRPPATLKDLPPMFYDSTTTFDWCLLLLIFVYQCVEFSLKWMHSSTATLLLSPRSKRKQLWKSFKREAWDSWFWFVSVLNLLTMVCFFQTWYHAYRLTLYDDLCLLFAVCCAFHWLSLVRYLHFSTRFQILGLTLRRGLPRVAQFLLGVLPIFIGYVLFGTIMFGAKVPCFQGITTTAVTLFSVANGDEIHDTFNAVAFTPWIGQLYVYSYMILFSYVVLMVCIGIIEDAFFSAVFPASWPSLQNPSKRKSNP